MASFSVNHDFWIDETNLLCVIHNFNISTCRSVCIELTSSYCLPLVIIIHFFNSFLFAFLKLICGISSHKKSGLRPLFIMYNLVSHFFHFACSGYILSASPHQGRIAHLPYQTSALKFRH